MKLAFYIFATWAASFDIDHSATNQKKCKQSNLNIEVQAAQDDIQPREVFIKEGDLVCFSLSTLDDQKKLMIEDYWDDLSVDKIGQKDYLTKKFEKTGDFTMKCLRGCPDLTDPKLLIHVLKAEDFDDKMKAKALEDSLKIKRK